jgi:anti-anti-sigma factor
MELITTGSNDSISRIALIGMFDMVAVGEIETRFTTATSGRGKNTIIDLAGMTFIASLGMGVLVTAYKGLKRKGAKLVLLNPQPDVESALNAARLKNILPIAHSEEEAERLLATA